MLACDKKTGYREQGRWFGLNGFGLQDKPGFGNGWWRRWADWPWERERRLRGVAMWWALGGGDDQHERC